MEFIIVQNWFIVRSFGGAKRIELGPSGLVGLYGVNIWIIVIEMVTLLNISNSKKASASGLGGSKVYVGFR